MKPISIKIKVFTGRVTLAVPCSYETACALYLKTKTPEPRDIAEYRTAEGMCVSTLKGSMIFLKKWNGTPHCHAVLAHEVVHAARQILGSCGVVEDAGTEEALCYLVDHILERLLKELMPRKPSSGQKVR